MFGGKCGRECPKLSTRQTTWIAGRFSKRCSYLSLGFLNEGIFQMWSKWQHSGTVCYNLCYFLLQIKGLKICSFLIWLLSFILWSIWVCVYRFQNISAVQCKAEKTRDFASVDFHFQVVSRVWKIKIKFKKKAKEEKILQLGVQITVLGPSLGLSVSYWRVKSQLDMVFSFLPLQRCLRSL